jgi:hypothetical protein
MWWASTQRWFSQPDAGLGILPGASMPLGRGEPFDRELAVAGLLARAEIGP